MISINRHIQLSHWHNREMQKDLKLDQRDTRLAAAIDHYLNATQTNS